MAPLFAALSIRRMLVVFLACLTITVAALLAACLGASQILSGARAYVAGEGLWSKAQKDALFHLVSYAENRDESEYQRFLSDLAVPLGDRKAREELQRPHPRLTVARQGFREGKNHPEDVSILIWIFQRFQHVGHFERAVVIWTQADLEIIRLRRAGIDLHREIMSGRFSESRKLELLPSINLINGRLTALENDFSFTLGEAARWVRRMVFTAVLGIAGFLTLVTAFVSHRAARLLKKEDDDLRQSEERYRSLLETATDAIISIDEGSVILFANRAAEKVFGYPIDELIGRKLTMVMPEYQRQRRDVEMRGLHRSGKEIPLELSFGEVVTAGKSTFTGIIRDVSDRKLAEKIQSATYRIAELTNSAEDLDSFYAALHRIIAELMYARNFYIAISDEKSGEIRFPYFVDEFDPPPTPLALGQGLTGHIIRTGEPLLLSEHEIAEMAADGSVEARGAITVDWLGVPLRSGERTFGVLAVQSYTEKQRYAQREKDLLVFVSRHVATAIERKRAEKEIERLAYEDALTGLANRTRFQDRLHLALANARREGYPLAVLFIDLDRFKVINDSLGHRTGDLILRKIAERLSQSIRSTDTLARLGGDEFTILLAKIDRPESAALVARKIQQSLRAPFTVMERELFVTISTGISVFPRDGEDADTLVKSADAAMYVAKEKGRDNYQFHSAGGPQGRADV